MTRDLNKELNDWEDWPAAWKPQAGGVLVGTVESYDTGFTPYGAVRTVIVMQGDGERVSLWLSSTVLLDLFRRHKPKPGERIGLKYLGKDPKKGYHRYHLIVDRPVDTDFTPLGGEVDDLTEAWCEPRGSAECVAVG